MAVSIKHKFVSTRPDNPTDVAAGNLVPSDWNEGHIIEGVVLTVNGDAPDEHGNVVVSGGPGGGIEDAPNDGKYYLRRNNQWEELVIS